MEQYKFNVSIEAASNEEAKQILTSMFDIMKTVRSRTSTKDFIAFAQALKNKPSLVDKAKFFM